jgi:predicted flap endonuclease-1-like 5' DNA nuclease
VVENQTINPIGFHPPFNNGTTTWTVSPALPGNLSIDGSTGEITGMVNTTMTNTSYTVTATHSSGATETFTFNLQSLADYDGDGLPNDLPSDYDAAEGPTSGLVADDDDDGDGLLDTVETNTGTYVDSSNTGTDPLNPDTDGDGICDGPLAVPGVCVAGPDVTNGATIVDTPIVLLNNSDVDEIAPFYPVTGATYGLSPTLPTSMQFDASNGSIWGTPDMAMANTTYTMWANLTDGTSTSWTFFLEVLEDLDGDGMPDVLPGDYDASNDPIRSLPGLEEDLDDDGDGYNDTAETDTGLYLDGNNTGTDPRDPDTDDDGICDGPGTVPGVCVAGPDLTPFGPPATVVAVNNTMIPSVPPYYAGSGLTYEVMPDLPAGLTIDPSNGFLMGVPTETIGNTTFTVYANHSDGTSYSWDFTIEVLEDSDGDGSPDTLPADYDGDNDSIRAPPGLTEDLDDDNDGASDLDEVANGTEPLDPDTDGDGFCDGINAVAGVCFAGPDPYPNNPNLPLDTDGDGLPDDDSDWTGPPYADLDDDNDGYPDVSEDACGSDSLDANSIPDDMDGDTICDGDDDDMDGDGIENVNETGDTTVPPGSSPINPDTDGDGICDGPESPVTSNCTAGPDMFPLDPSAWEDTDGDGYPNELFPPSNSTPPLEEDLDDDNDGWSDIDEVNCGSDPVNASDMPVDENGDGICDVLDLDWDDDGIPNANETDTGVYVDASDTGTDPWNPDTDGDGFCDGPFAVFDETDTVCIAGPDPFPHDPNMPIDTDGDGMPNELPEDYIGNLVEDTDDDNDGYSDVSELNCDSDPLDAASTPTNDLDGDGLCDAEDPDVDGDGLSNETELAEGSLTSYMNADTDGDGVCDGPSAPALPAGICVAGPDAFPDDAAAWLDTDGDGDPDELVDGIMTDLVLDTDDDNDGWSDEGELACGTNSKDDMSTPFDGDDDGICDVLDTQTLGYTINDVEAEMFEAYVNQSDFVLRPNLTGMEPGLWTIEPALPAGLSFSGTARSGETGIITGIPTEASPMTNYTVTADNGRVNISFTFGLGVLNDFDGDRVPDEPSLTGLEEDLDDDNDGHSDIIELKCGTDPVNQTSIPDVDEEGNCIEGKYAEDDSDDGNGFLMCLMPLCLILLLALLLFALLFRDKVILMGPEPENTTSDPAFLSGEGTKADPFVLKPVKALKAGTTVEAKETISIVNMSPEIRVNLLDLAESTNDKRFRMYEVDGTTEEPGFNLEADEEGRLRLRFVFDDSDDPTYPGGTYEGLLKLGKASVYLSWTVDVKEDKRMMNKIRKEQEAAEKAEKEAEEKAKAEAEAKEAEEKAKAEAEAKAAEEKAAKEAEKKAKAEEKAAAAALAKKEKEEAAAKKKEEAAAKKAKAAEEKAAKEAEEAEKKAKAEEKAAAAAAAKKAKEEEEAKRKAEAEAKAAEEKAKPEAAAKKKAEKKPATTKEAKKQEELQRVKQRAKTIDFKVLGEAESSELKSEVKKGATTLEVANAKDFAESGSAEINDAKGSTIIAWTGKDGNTLTGVSGVTRVFAAKAVLMVKDDLQVIKGIGPFIEEKLNALGITTYRQLANMTAKLETQVNEAIEFFPGRVKRDQWVAQAKILLGEDVKLDEKALKQAEELERIAQKAEGIDFGILGVASASEADDLQKIKGIGPFIAEKLNALGIYKFSQLANMTSEIEEEVNVAIEFFPGRVKRDEWAKQAKEFDSN